MKNLNIGKNYIGYYKSEIGFVKVIGTADSILYVSFVDEAESIDNTDFSPCVKDCLEQLDEYFKGKRKEFSLKLELQGTDFQKKIWNQLLKVPFGETASYKDIAIAIGKDNAYRAVGSANKENKIAIIIPCHRIIKHNGEIGNYGGGVWRKKWLLKYEKSFI